MRRWWLAALAVVALGAHEPLSRADLEQKFRLNCANGGWPAERTGAFLSSSKAFFEKPVDLSAFR